MRLKGFQRYGWAWGLAFIAFVAVILVFVFKGPSPTATEGPSYFCDAETVEGDAFVSGLAHFSNAQCQSDTKAYRSKHSCLCDPDQIYGMGLSLSDLVPGDTLIYSVRRYPEAGPGALVFSTETPEIFQKQMTGQSTSRGWDLLVDTIILPKSFENGRTMVYPFYTGEGEKVYFDNLTVDVKSASDRTSSEIYEGSTLGIQLTKANLERLKTKRDQAYERGLLFSSKEDLVPAKIKVDDKDYSVKLRLKGDLLDHLQDKFWSYRIVMKKGENWNGMTQFSIHNSKARSHIAEWLMHEVFRREGIITPRYDFINVNSNDIDLGAYAYEQYFEDEMLLENGRQVGPILRHNDEAYWANVQKNLHDFSWVRSAEVESMNNRGGNFSKDQQLHLAGRSMLAAFLKGNKSAEEVFDIDLMAKYYALLNLSHSNHAQLITNIRFYLNPFTGLLEPIAYDCFGSDLPPVTREWTSIGEGMNRNADYTHLYEEGYIYEVELFKDMEFFKRFLHYSFVYNSPAYIDTLIAEFDDPLVARRNFIRKDPKYQDYNFSWDVFTKKGRYTFDKLLPKPFLSLKSWYTSDDQSEVLLKCYHYFPIEVVGFGNESMEYELDRPIVLEAFNDKLPVEDTTVGLQQFAQYVYFRTCGIDSVFREKISDQTTSPATIDFVQYDIEQLKALDFLEINDKVISFKPGAYEVTSPVAIPNSYTVQVPAGTTIYFEDKGAIISRSPVLALGSAEQPISFIGDKRSMNGLAVIGAGAESVFQNCKFMQLSGIAQGSVLTEGALTFYQSSGVLTSCVFENITARDALQSVKSTIRVENSSFINCQGDAIDLDQSTLELYSVQMQRIGQDAIEMDGGNLLANNITIDHCFQYGFRARGKLKAAVYALEMNDCENGIVASNGATIKLFGPKFNTLQNGFIVESQGHAQSSIHVTNFDATEVQNTYMMDRSSELIINDSKKRPL